MAARPADCGNGCSGHRGFPTCITIHDWTHCPQHMTPYAALSTCPNARTALLILLMVFHVSPSPIKMHWWACSDPADEHCAAVFALADPSKEFCTLSRDAWSWTHSRWSVISQFNLVCGSAWKSQLANAGFFMGYLIGSGVFGGVSDSRGRKPVLFGCTAFGAACTVGVGLAPNYVVYFIMRLLTGIGAAGQALTAYILATESVGPAWRGTAGVTTQCVFIFGEAGRGGADMPQPNKGEVSKGRARLRQC